MKRNVGLVWVLMGGIASAFAQTSAPVPPPPEANQIMGDEAVNIQQTIDGYVQGAMHRGRLELFDRKKGKNVILRLDRIALDDPARTVQVKADQLAICGECTEIASSTDEQGEIQEKGTGDSYEVWFLLQRRSTYPAFSRVIHVYIKSVNGHSVNTWTQDESGHWAITRVPDAS